MTTTEIHAAARARFEQWAGLYAPHLPPDPVDAMQVRLARWQVLNFGPQSDERFALGVLEECGELDEAYEAGNGEAAVDALGDVLVYAGQLAISNRLALGPLLATAPNLHPDGCHTADPTEPRDCTSDGHHECTSCARFDAAGRAAMGDDPIGGPRVPLPKGG